MNELLEQARERFAEWKVNLDFSQAQRRSLLLLLILILLGTVVVVTRGSSTPIVAPVNLPLLITPANITVDVAGGVVKPGVYSLPENSRVIDALTAAGGANSGTDVSDINLARIVKDGEQIYVEPTTTSLARNSQVNQQSNSSGNARSSVSHARANNSPININRATEKDFDTLPGIGPVIAERIVAYRKSHGPFATIEELQKVSGIGSAKFAQLKSKVRV